MISAAIDELAAMLQTSEEPANIGNLSVENRQIIANGNRLIARNRDHIRYVTSREQELTRKGGSAYDALVAALDEDESQVGAVDAYSSAVSQVHLAFESLT